MKIAIVTPGFAPVPAVEGGAVENLVELILAENEIQRKLEIEVYSIFHEEAMSKSKKYDHTYFRFFRQGKAVSILDKIVYQIARKVLRRKNLISYRYIFTRLSVIKQYTKILKKEKYDRIILVGNPTLMSMLHDRKLRGNNVGTVVFWAHNEVRSFYGGDQYTDCLYKIIGVSEYVNRSIANKFEQLDNVKFDVLKNCVRKEFWQEEYKEKTLDFMKQYQIAPGDFVLMYAGRISEEKGVYEVVSAYKKIRSKYKNMKLVLVGASFYAQKIESDYEIKIKRMISEMNDVIVTGYVSYEDVSALYRMADVSILPSVWEEPAGMTILEMALLGIPVITTDAGGIPEYYNIPNAILLKRDNNMVNTIATYIEKLYEDEIFYKKIRNEEIKMRELFSPDFFYNNFIHSIQ